MPSCQRVVAKIVIAIMRRDYDNCCVAQAARGSFMPMEIMRCFAQYRRTFNKAP